MGGSVVAAGKDAGSMADAALHRMGQHLGLSSRAKTLHEQMVPPDVPTAEAPEAEAFHRTQAPRSTRAQQRDDLLAADTASSMDLDGAAGVPLPGQQDVSWILPAACCESQILHDVPASDLELMQIYRRAFAAACIRFAQSNCNVSALATLLAGWLVCISRVALPCRG